MSPSQDIVMGCYYMTCELPGRKGEGMTFAGYDEVEFAFSQGILDLHAKIKMRLPKAPTAENGRQLRKIRPHRRNHTGSSAIQ